MLIPTFVKIDLQSFIEKKSVYYHNTDTNHYVIEVAKERDGWDGYQTYPKITKAEVIYNY